MNSPINQCDCVIIKIVILIMQAQFKMKISDFGSIEGFVGYFDTDFKGSEENPTWCPVTLSTAPDPTGATHWGQQIFQVHPSLPCIAGDELDCDFEMKRRKDNHRLLEINMNYRMIRASGAMGGHTEQECKAYYIIE